MSSEPPPPEPVLFARIIEVDLPAGAVVYLDGCPVAGPAHVTASAYLGTTARITIHRRTPKAPLKRGTK